MALDRRFLRPEYGAGEPLARAFPVVDGRSRESGERPLSSTLPGGRSARRDPRRPPGARRLRSIRGPRSRDRAAWRPGRFRRRRLPGSSRSPAPARAWTAPPRRRRAFPSGRPARRGAAASGGGGARMREPLRRRRRSRRNRWGERGAWPVRPRRRSRMRAPRARRREARAGGDRTRRSAPPAGGRGRRAAPEDRSAIRRGGSRRRAAVPLSASRFQTPMRRARRPRFRASSTPGRYHSFMRTLAIVLAAAALALPAARAAAAPAAVCRGDLDPYGAASATISGATSRGRARLRGGRRGGRASPGDVEGALLSRAFAHETAAMGGGVGRADQNLFALAVLL